ncbi:MAG TPA: helix-turn-helix domain-containing protein [Solirubrobacteraceae bacterium]|nr:helix-turn-helix domain-containing protein [Solirubrobacteraceae bacterium]
MNEIFSEAFLDTIVERLAPRVAEEIAAQMPDTRPVWMNFRELVEYTRIPEGTLRKIVAKGAIPKYGKRNSRFHREEVDLALRSYFQSEAA